MIISLNEAEYTFGPTWLIHLVLWPLFLYSTVSTLLVTFGVVRVRPANPAEDMEASNQRELIEKIVGAISPLIPTFLHPNQSGNIPGTDGLGRGRSVLRRRHALSLRGSPQETTPIPANRLLPLHRLRPRRSLLTRQRRLARLLRLPGEGGDDTPRLPATDCVVGAVEESLPISPCFEDTSLTMDYTHPVHQDVCTTL